MNKYSFTLAGSSLAILSARIYVLSGGNLNYSFLGYELHHFYYGISLLVLAGLLRIRNKVPESLNFFFVGLGLGYVTDEFNLLLSIGRSYTLELYYSPVNILMDFLLILILFRLGQNHAYVNGLLYDSETVL